MNLVERVTKLFKIAVFTTLISGTEKLPSIK